MSKTPADLKYADSHEWAKLQDNGRVRVGISDFAQEQLGDVVFIELPELGKPVKAGKPCAVIESVKAASDIYSPVSGEIVEINEALKDAPELVNSDSYSHWLFEIQPSNPEELDKLLDANGYQTSINNA